LILIDAVAEQIRRTGKPIVTWFDVEDVVRRLFRERKFDGKPLKIRRDYPTTETFGAIRRALINPYSLDLRGALSELIELQSALLEQAAESGGQLLVEDPEFSGQVWRVAGVPDGTPEELCCLADPWCYVSHLSAMQRWGFSNRNPLALHITRPARKIWRQQADAELREIQRTAPSDLVSKGRIHVTFPSSLRRRELLVFQPSYLGHSVTISDSHARVGTVGQTFWDMMQEPRRCGGMAHVMEIWQEKAEDYIEEIISVFEDKEMPTTNLAFCRAGYVFEEIVGHQDSRIAAWTRFGKQGGSAKLDPEAPFETRHSERWNLSLNV
jgi:predicted transcriptional regulator of viral defense system